MNKKHRIISINGESWCRNLTGIERVAIETTKELDKLVSPGMIELIVPCNAKNVPSFDNIKIIKLDKTAVFFPKWTQIYFQRYIIKNKRISLDFSNTCPYFTPGIEYIHDIYAKLYPSDYGSNIKDKLIHTYSNIMYKRIAKKAKAIITVSEFSKKTIVDTYKINPKRVNVVYAGINNYGLIKADKTIFDDFPILNEKSFYFSLGSLSTRKNLKWILQHASLYPNEHFVISGKSLQSIVPEELSKLNNLKNVTMVGYVSDERVKALFEKCKAFILPSYFEGFGIPPLEALSSGAKVIISNTSSLPELYGNCAYYIDPSNPNINLDELLQKKVDSPDSILEKFTFKNSARKLFEIINKIY